LPGIPRRLAGVANTGTLLVPPDYPFGSPRTARPHLMPPGVAGVCHARGRPMTPPNSIKMIAPISIARPKGAERSAAKSIRARSPPGGFVGSFLHRRHRAFIQARSLFTICEKRSWHDHEDRELPGTRRSAITATLQWNPHLPLDQVDIGLVGCHSTVVSPIAQARATARASSSSCAYWCRPASGGEPMLLRLRQR
jgi:hypothetical protein